MRAWRAKMSMIRADRSSTLQSSSFSRLRCWFGASSSSTTSRLKLLAAFSSTSSAARPLPKYHTGSGAARRWKALPTTVAPAVSASAPSSARLRPTGHCPSRGLSRPIRNARSTGSVRSIMRLRSDICSVHASRSPTTLRRANGRAAERDRYFRAVASVTRLCHTSPHIRGHLEKRVQDAPAGDDGWNDRPRVAGGSRAAPGGGARRQRAGRHRARAAAGRHRAGAAHALPGQLAGRHRDWWAWRSTTWSSRRWRRSRADLTVRYEAALADALADPLTGLGNHRAFQEELDRQVDGAQRYGAPVVAGADRPRRLQVDQRHQGPRLRRPGAGPLRRAGRSAACARWIGPSGSAATSSPSSCRRPMARPPRS